jgi:sigma-B regulation protein RsbU (phosphoserine phosphatase)
VDIPQRRIGIAPGDAFILHSDGIYEATNAYGDVYGLDRLVQVVREHGGGTAESLRDAILADVAAFRGLAEQDDDVTVVVCRIL